MPIHSNNANVATTITSEVMELRTVAQSDLPMTTVNVRAGGQIMRLCSTLSQFGTALDVGMEELLIESYFPADESSRAFFRKAEPDIARFA